jgi:hypothetical protein
MFYGTMNHRNVLMRFFSARWSVLENSVKSPANEPSAWYKGRCEQMIHSSSRSCQLLWSTKFRNSVCGNPLLISVLPVDTSWLRLVAAGFSPRRPGFAPRSVHVGLVVDRVALGQVFSPSPSVFPCHYHSAAALYSLVYHLGVGHWVLQRPQSHRDVAPPNTTIK